MLAGVGEASGLFAVHAESDIDVVGGMEDLRLAALIGSEVIQVEGAASLMPGIEDQVEGGAVIAVRVNRPVGEDNVGALGLEQLADLAVAGAVDLSGAVDLAGKDGPRVKDRAGFEGLGGADGGCLPCSSLP